MTCWSTYCVLFSTVANRDLSRSRFSSRDVWPCYYGMFDTTHQWHSTVAIQQINYTTFYPRMLLIAIISTIWQFEKYCLRFFSFKFSSLIFSLNITKDVNSQLGFFKHCHSRHNDSKKQWCQMCWFLTVHSYFNQHRKVVKFPTIISMFPPALPKFPRA